MAEPYYEDNQVALFLGDCRVITEWLEADVLVTDPPYGRGWHQNAGLANGDRQGHGKRNPGIRNDEDTAVRDQALSLWDGKPAVMFGDLLMPQPAGAVQALIYAKPADAGIRGARGGWRRDAEVIYLIGSWPVGIGGESSIIRTNGWVAGPRGVAIRNGHPHAKPADVMETLIRACPAGTIADPFAGSGSTLIAARNLGRTAVGAELEERYCEVAARRLSQMPLDLEAS